MRIFIEAIDLDVQDTIENGSFVLTKVVDGKSVEKPRSEWTKKDKKKDQYNLKSKNIITSILGHDEFFHVSNYKTAQEIRDTLQVTHDGTSEVKRVRIRVRINTHTRV